MTKIILFPAKTETKNQLNDITEDIGFLVHAFLYEISTLKTFLVMASCSTRQQTNLSLHFFLFSIGCAGFVQGLQNQTKCMEGP